MRQNENVRVILLARVAEGAQIVISAITYSELKDGVSGPKASPRHAELLEEFLKRLDAVVAWDKEAVEHTCAIRADLRTKGTPISPNDSAIAGHAVALGAVLATNNVREFSRVANLAIEDWVA